MPVIQLTVHTQKTLLLKSMANGSAVMNATAKARAYLVKELAASAVMPAVPVREQESVLHVRVMAVIMSMTN